MGINWGLTASKVFLLRPSIPIGGSDRALSLNSF